MAAKVASLEPLLDAEFMAPRLRGATSEVESRGVTGIDHQRKPPVRGDYNQGK